MARYFEDSEIEGLDPRLVLLLDQLRFKVGEPLIITSGKRNPTDNSMVNGKNNSAHLAGLAVDLRCNSSSLRFKLVKAAFEVGFRRIEDATEHIHLDIDETKDQDVMWVGVSK